MEQKGIDLETFSCSICLDLLKDPVTTPCGHNYCMTCIETHWDEEEDRKFTPSCPQCRHTFTPRPVLLKNTMLANVVEDLNKTRLCAAPADHCYAGAEEVFCDFCTEGKVKAFKSCLTCLISYCEDHLQPHHDVPQLKNHKLVDPSTKLQENVCSRHGEVMKMFCRTDQKCICCLCSVEEHKGHNTVSAAAEREERQKDLEGSRRNIQQKIQDREKDVKLLQEEAGAIARSANKAVEESEELIRLMEKRCSDVKQQVRSRQKTEERRVRELQEKLRQEITELKHKDEELKQLSHTEDHNQFLHSYLSLAPLSESTCSVHSRPRRYLEDVAAAMSEVRDKLQNILRDEQTSVSPTGTEVRPLEPKTRAEFLKYSCEITLDETTAHRQLSLSEENRKVTSVFKPQICRSHPDRFTGCCQVLSRESLSGRCYWEVDWKGTGVFVAVAYKKISRKGGWNESRFGQNDKSWALECTNNGYNFGYNKVETPVSGPRSSRVGLFLDHSAGVLSFYSISETTTLLHRVHTTFTQPLYAGLLFYFSSGDTAEFCELKQTEAM